MKRCHGISSERIATSFFWILFYFFSFLGLAVCEIDLLNSLRVYNLLYFPGNLIAFQLDFGGLYHTTRLRYGNALVVCDLYDLYLHSGHFFV